MKNSSKWVINQECSPVYVFFKVGILILSLGSFTSNAGSPKVLDLTSLGKASATYHATQNYNIQHLDKDSNKKWLDVDSSNKVDVGILEVIKKLLRQKNGKKKLLNTLKSIAR